MMESIKKVKLDKDDIIVLKLKVFVSDNDAKRLVKDYKEAFVKMGLNNNVILVNSNVDFSVLSKNDSKESGHELSVN